MRRLRWRNRASARLRGLADALDGPPQHRVDPPAAPSPRVLSVGSPGVLDLDHAPPDWAARVRAATAALGLSTDAEDALAPERTEANDPWDTTDARTSGQAPTSARAPLHERVRYAVPRRLPWTVRDHAEPTEPAAHVTQDVPAGERHLLRRPAEDRAGAAPAPPVVTRPPRLVLRPRSPLTPSVERGGWAGRPPDRPGAERVSWVPAPSKPARTEAARTEACSADSSLPQPTLPASDPAGDMLRGPAGTGSPPPWMRRADLLGSPREVAERSGADALAPSAPPPASPPAQAPRLPSEAHRTPYRAEPPRRSAMPTAVPRPPAVPTLPTPVAPTPPVDVVDLWPALHARVEGPAPAGPPVERAIAASARLAQEQAAV